MSDLINAYYKQIGLRIKNAREQAKLNHAELAQQLGLSATELIDFEEGKQKITPSMLIA